MPAIHSSEWANKPIDHNAIVKRNSNQNWAAQEPGVVLVFCIVFIVGCGILALIIHRAWRTHKEERAQWEVTEIKEVEKRH